MSMTMTCKHCGTEVSADGEDALVDRVQAHARSHEGGPELTREHILARFHRLQAQTHDHDEPEHQGHGH